MSRARRKKSKTSERQPVAWIAWNATNDAEPSAKNMLAVETTAEGAMLASKSTGRIELSAKVGKITGRQQIERACAMLAKANEDQRLRCPTCHRPFGGVS